MTLPFSRFRPLQHKACSVDNSSSEARRTKHKMELCSVTAESSYIMPRVGPREVLVKALSDSHFDKLKCFEDGVKTARLMLTIMARSLGRRTSAKNNRLIQKPRRSFQSRMMMYRGIQHFLAESEVFRVRDELILYLLETRYLGDRVLLPKSTEWFLQVLPSYPEDFFSQTARMSRRAFEQVVNLLETKASGFFHKPGKQKQLPVSVQLMLALFCLGYYGNGAEFGAIERLGYSVGTIFTARRRVCRAVACLGRDYIKWPGPDDRRELRHRCKDKYGYEWAFFLVDGTTHPFVSAPSYDRNAWFDRKSRYSMQALVSCDMDLRILHLLIGWPGSTHDARVIKSSDYMKESNEHHYFTGMEHGLGDAAFGMHRRVIPNYKEPLASLPENRLYNLYHSSFRVLSEHCIGSVKGRFQGLREVRMQLRRKKDLEEIIPFILSGYVLHNILLKLGEGGCYERDENNQETAGLEANLVHEPEQDSTNAAAVSDIREQVKHQVLRAKGFE